jgi:hypothetical protein
MGGNGSGNNFVAIIVVVSLYSLINVTKKKKTTYKEGQREIFCSWGPLGNKKKRFQFHFSIKRPCG